jgi:hypothetical protein
MSLPAILSAATTTAEATKMEKTVPNTKKKISVSSKHKIAVDRKSKIKQRIDLQPVHIPLKE